MNTDNHVIEKIRPFGDIEEFLGTKPQVGLRVQGGLKGKGNRRGERRGRRRGRTI